MIEQVLYPGLPSFAGHASAAKQMKGGFGGMLAITMSRLPHMGRMGNIFFSHGYSGQGVALAGIYGK